MSKATYFGFNPPFLSAVQSSINTNVSDTEPNRYSGILPRQSDLRLVKNDVLQLLLTLRGERVQRPTFGTSLRSTVFEPMTDKVISDLQSDLLTAISENEPRLINVDIQLTPVPKDLLLKITITGNMSYDPTEQFLLNTSIPAPGVAI
jgi:phage baseplate assembly protein W